MTAKELPDIQLGDLLAQLDTSILYLLERRFLDAWRSELNVFVPRHSRLDWETSFHGFRLEGLRYYGQSETGLALQNMENLLGIFRDGSHSFLCCIDGRGRRVPQISFLACGRMSARSGITTQAYGDLMRRGLRANFPGALIKELEVADYTSFAADVKRYPHVGVMTGIPSRKSPVEKFFAQGLERFLDSIAGLDCACLIVAEPYTVAEMMGLIDPVLALKNEVGQFHRFTLTDTTTISDSLGQTMTVGGMLSKTVGRTFLGAGGAALSAMGAASAAGAKIGGMIGSIFPGIGTAIGAAIGAAAGPVLLAAGVMAAKWPLTKTVSETLGGFASYSLTKTRTSGRSVGVSREAVNFVAEYALQVLDNQIERLRYGRSYGFWKVGVYFFAKDASSYTAVKSSAASAFSGTGSAFEPIRFVDLDVPAGADSRENRQGAICEIIAGYNPRVKYLDSIQEAIAKEQKRDISKVRNPLGECMDGLSTPMTTGELAILVAPPQRECRALSVTERAVLGGKTITTGTVSNEGRSLELGELLYFGQRSGETVRLPINDLARHVLVAGITGSGKTNTVQGWCIQLTKVGIPWMVIEPSGKREYRNLLGAGGRDTWVFSLGTEGVRIEETETGVGAPFRLNPFFFPRGVNILSHMDGIKAAFSAAFPMYASMPYLLEEAIVRVYRDCGWDLARTTNGLTDDPWDPKQSFVFPTLQDLYEKIDPVVRSKGYDIRLQMDLSAALRTRIGSLLIGGRGAMLNTSASLDMEKLRERNVVLEMADIGNDDDKCLLIALILLAMQEQAMRSPANLGGELRHVLVVEEAHRLFRKALPADNPEIANIRGAAVEQFANALAEMRGFGQGVIVVEQIPSKLIPDVIKNTALKCIHQLGAVDDRKAVGEAMTLDAGQQMELARLNPRNGEAVLYHQSWEKAYMVKVPLLGTPPVAATMLQEMRRSIIRKHSVLFGEDGERVGFVASEVNEELRIDVARVLLSLAFTEPALASGLKSLGPTRVTGLDHGLAKGARNEEDMNRILAAYDEGFLEFIRDLMRTGSARASLLAECPEGFAELKEAIRRGQDIVDRLRDLHEQVAEALETPERSTLMKQAAVRYYARRFEMGAIPPRIGQKEAGEKALEALHNEIATHAERVARGPHLRAVRREIERLMVEQSFELAGAVDVKAIVETYRMRFLVDEGHA